MNRRELIVGTAASLTVLSTPVLALPVRKQESLIFPIIRHDNPVFMLSTFKSTETVFPWFAPDGINETSFRIDKRTSKDRSWSQDVIDDFQYMDLCHKETYPSGEWPNWNPDPYLIHRTSNSIARSTLRGVGNHVIAHRDLKIDMSRLRIKSLYRTDDPRMKDRAFVFYRQDRENPNIIDGPGFIVDDGVKSHLVLNRNRYGNLFSYGQMVVFA